MVPFPAALARSAREAGPGGECRRPIFGNSLAGNLWNSQGPPQNLFCGALFHVKHFPGLLPPSCPEGEAKPRGRRGAGVQKLAASESANGGFRGAFRLWCNGPPAAFLSTFRRWKVDIFPAKPVLRGPRFIEMALVARNAGSRRPTPHSRRGPEGPLRPWRETVPAALRRTHQQKRPLSRSLRCAVFALRGLIFRLCFRPEDPGSG